MTMRERFYELAAEALEQNERVAVVLADIGAGAAPRRIRAGSTSASASS